METSSINFGKNFFFFFLGGGGLSSLGGKLPLHPPKI